MLVGPTENAWDQLKATLREKIQQTMKEQSKRRGISIKLQRDREQALQRLNWQRGVPTPNPETIIKLEEEWYHFDRRLDRLLEASMNA